MSIVGLFEYEERGFESKCVMLVLFLVFVGGLIMQHMIHGIEYWVASQSGSMYFPP